MLMGSAEVLAAAPEKATVFAEDLPQEELDAAEATNPAGLANLGNTCYLNSSLQCMRAVPEISTALQKFVGGSDGPYGEANGFISAMQQLNSELDRSNSAKEVKPFKFVSLFRTAYPMFAQQNEQGGGFMQQASAPPTQIACPVLSSFSSIATPSVTSSPIASPPPPPRPASPPPPPPPSSQDAEECWSTLISALAGRLQLPSGADPSDLPSAPGPLLPRMEALRHNLGDMLFGIEMECS